MRRTQERLRRGLAGGEGITSARPVQFAADLRVREMILDELARMAEAIDVPEARPATARKTGR